MNVSEFEVQTEAAKRRSQEYSWRIPSAKRRKLQTDRKPADLRILDLRTRSEFLHAQHGEAAESERDFSERGEVDAESVLRRSNDSAGGRRECAIKHGGVDDPSELYKQSYQDVAW